MIELRGVCKSFVSHNTRIDAVKNADLTFAQGQVSCIVGESGCGKSTLLKIIAGLERPDSGKLCFDGKPVSDSDWRQLRQRIGYVIQDGGLFPHLTARDNVALAARAGGWDLARRQKRIRELTEMVNLDDRCLAQYPHQLSGGQRQRVALMRALMLDPDLLLLDEPLGALDPIIRHKLQNELRTLFRELGKTALIVTHDLAEAVHFSDDLIVMLDGRICQRAAFSRLRNQPAEPYVSDLVNAVRELPS